MKITKSNNMKHKKNVKYGYLEKDNKKIISRITGKENIINELNSLKFKESLLHKINHLDYKKLEEENLSKNIKKIINKFMYNEIKSFTKSLIYEKDINYTSNTLNKLYSLKNNEDLKKYILNAFTEYGKNFKSNIIKKETGENLKFSIPDLIYKIIFENGLNDSSKEMIEHMQISLKSKLDNTKLALTNSLINNKYLLFIEEDKLYLTSKRLRWVETFLDLDNKKINKDKFLDLENKYRFDKLEELFKTEILDDTIFNKEKNVYLSAKIKDILSIKHEKINLNFSKETDDDFRFYIEEVRKYIKHYFPIKISSRNNKMKSGKKYKKEYFEYYLNINTIKQTVRKQIKNKITNILIQKGKIRYYNQGNYHKYRTEKLNSTYLEKLKIEEIIRKKILESTVFANSTLRYILDCEEDKDIIGISKGYESSRDNILQSNNINDLINKLEYYYDLNSTNNELYLKENIKKILDSLFSSINNIRNNIYHYKPLEKTLADILAMNEKEIKSEKEVLFYKDIVTQIFTNDKENLKNKFLNKIISMNLNLYYSKNTLIEIFTKFEFNLSTYIVDLVPSFTNVFKKGNNIKENYSTYNCNWYNKNIYDEQVFNTYKNLLQLIYNYMFIPSLKNNEEKIVQAINNVKKYNIEINKNNKNPKEIAYSQIPKCTGDPQKYFSKLLSDLIIKENENEKNHIIKTKYNKYQKFVQEVYAFAFASFMQENFSNLKAKILNPKYDKTDNYKFKLEFEKYIKIKSSSKYPLMSYMFLKTLDDRQLSKLKNQIIKYISCNQKFVNKKLDNEVLEVYYNILELIEFVKIVRPVINYNNENIEDFKLFETFMEDENVIEKYKQGEDKIIVYSGMERILKTKIIKLYSEKFKECKITNSDIEKYSYYNEKINGVSKIESLQENYKNIHANYLSKSKITNEELEKYNKLIKEISNYNNLKNKVTFFCLSNLYDIHIEILSRLIGFVNYFERDLMFIMISLYEYGMFSDDITMEDILDSFKGNILFNLKNKKIDILNKNKDILNMFKEIFYLKSSNLDDFKIRNNIMHLDDIKSNKNIIDTINKTRRLMAYDRKRKNAVMKSIIKILQKYGIQMNFRYNNGDFESKTIKTVKIRHLKDKKINNNQLELLEIDKCGYDLIKLVEKLFNKNS